MVAMSIIAVVLTAILGSQSQSLSLAGEAKFSTTASLLAQGKMAEIEMENPQELISDSGDFGDAPGSSGIGVEGRVSPRSLFPAGGIRDRDAAASGSARGYSVAGRAFPGVARGEVGADAAPSFARSDRRVGTATMVRKRAGTAELD